jgi:hypothetical protein
MITPPLASRRGRAPLQASMPSNAMEDATEPALIITSFHLEPKISAIREGRFFQKIDMAGDIPVSNTAVQANYPHGCLIDLLRKVPDNVDQFGASTCHFTPAIQKALPYVPHLINPECQALLLRNLGGHPSLSGFTKVSRPFLYRKSHTSAPSANVLYRTSPLSKASLTTQSLKHR